MLGFLAPLFLAGLLAIAIPVVVHLVNKERKTVVAFPSLMFLEKVPYKSVRRRRLRDLLLLALRCLAIAALAAAFARPLLNRQSAAVTAGGAREVVVLLDRSASMQREGQWAKAQDVARKAVAGLGPGDRASVVLFDADAEAVTQPTADPGLLRAAIDGATPGAGGTRYAPALRLAQKLLAESDRPRREAVMISDFQRRGWEAREEVRLPDGATFATHDVGGEAAPNAAVAGVTLRRDRAGDRDRLTAQARVVSTASCAGTACGAARPVAVTLALGGRAVETKSVSVAANGAATVDFAPVSVPSGSTRGTVSLAADALPADDAHHFVVAPARDLSVLVLEPSGARPNQSLYLRRALELAERPAVRVDVRAADRATIADLSGRALVVLNDGMPREGPFARRLAEWVREGGGLLAALGPRADDVAGPMAALLPVRVGEVRDRGVDGGRLAVVDLSHRALEAFALPRAGDFATARVLRHRASQAADSATVLARWDDGSVALAERAAGRGRVVSFGSTFDTYWNDLPLQPVWVPLVHRLVRHAAGWSEAKSAYVVGERVGASDVGRRTSDDGRRSSEIAVAESPSGARVPLDSARGAVVLREAGFWTIRATGAAPGTGEVIAANVDPAEGDPARVEPETIVAAVTMAPGGRPTSDVRRPTSDVTPVELERRQMLWWYFLAAAALALAAELLVANRLSRGRVRT